MAAKICVFLLLGGFSIATASKARCIAEFNQKSPVHHLGTSDGKNYYYSAQPVYLTRPEAKTLCEENNLTLASIEDQSQTTFVMSRLKERGMEWEAMWTSAKKERTPRCSSMYWESTDEDLDGTMFEIPSYGYYDPSRGEALEEFGTIAGQQDGKIVIYWHNDEATYENVLCQRVEQPEQGIQDESDEADADNSNSSEDSVSTEE